MRKRDEQCITEVNEDGSGDGEGLEEHIAGRMQGDYADKMAVAVAAQHPSCEN